MVIEQQSLIEQSVQLLPRHVGHTAEATQANPPSQDNGWHLRSNG